jgi:hypothetical protein
MKKKYFLLSVVGVLIVLMSFGLGYACAYIHGLIKAWDMVVTTHAEILLADSGVLTKKLRSSDIAELIEATEENGDSLCNFIIEFKPVTKNAGTRKLIDIALAKWEQAKERLQELRALQSENTNDSP